MTQIETENKFLGILPDERTEEEKAQEYKHEERGFATASPIEYKELTSDRLIGLPTKRQFYTSQCVGQSLGKHLGKNNMVETGEYVDLSGEFIYYWRNNKNTNNPHGMGKIDAATIAVNKGSCKNIMIEQRIRDTEPEPIITRNMIDNAVQYAGKNYFSLENITMDNIARIIDQQGSIILWFYFDVDGEEWWNENPTIKFPNLKQYDAKATRHSVYSDLYGLRNGKQVIVIEDSAGNNTALNNQMRFIDESFLKRCFEAWYIIDKKNLPTPDIQKPKVFLNLNLKAGSNGVEVKKLQEVLMYEGFLKIEKPTIYFRGMTLAAVKQYQKKYGLKVDGIVGPITRGHINNKYE